MGFVQLLQCWEKSQIWRLRSWTRGREDGATGPALREGRGVGTVDADDLDVKLAVARDGGAVVVAGRPRRLETAHATAQRPCEPADAATAARGRGRVVPAEEVVASVAPVHARRGGRTVCLAQHSPCARGPERAEVVDALG